tara:strand:- start:258 stop:467 length:210 start_codon:yes stop_codon:yes gene_type:complete
MMNKETTMIGVEITGGVKKDRELAEEIVWFCLEKMLPRHRALNITVLLTRHMRKVPKGSVIRKKMIGTL